MNSATGEPTRNGYSPRPHDPPPRKTQRTTRVLAPLAATDAGDPRIVTAGGRYPPRRARNFMLRRAKWILAIMLVVVAAAAKMSWSHTPTYKSSADVLVQPRMFAAGTAPQVPDMGSERAVAESSAVLRIAARALHTTSSEIGHGLSVSVPLNTFVLHISYSSTHPAAAQQRAQAVADAYVKYWVSEQPQIADQATKRPSTDILKTAVISDAKLPTTPSSPHHKVDISIAIVVGLIVGLGTAYLRDRLDDRVRDQADLERFGERPVLAAIPSTSRLRPHRKVVLAATASNAAIAYEDLAMHLLRLGMQRPTQVVLITSPSGRSQATVSANLSVAMARAGRQVLLVHANLRAPGVPTAFGTDATLGLAALIEGCGNASDVVQPTSIAGLRELPTGVIGGNVAAALHSDQLRNAVRDLCTLSEIVVIDGPPILAGADVATLTEISDCVVATGDVRSTTRAEVRAAAARLIPVQAKLTGWVLVNDHAPLDARLRALTRRRDREPRHAPRSQPAPPGPNDAAPDRLAAESKTAEG